MTRNARRADVAAGDVSLTLPNMHSGWPQRHTPIGACCWAAGAVPTRQPVCSCSGMRASSFGAHRTNAA